MCAVVGGRSLQRGNAVSAQAQGPPNGAPVRAGPPARWPVVASWRQPLPAQMVHTCITHVQPTDPVPALAHGSV